MTNPTASESHAMSPLATSGPKGLPAGLPASTLTAEDITGIVQATRIRVDLRQRAVEGFRSLSVIAIFLAALQGQLVSTTATDNSQLSYKFLNAFWLAGLFLDVFGAFLAVLTARWFEVLEPPEAEYLNEIWSAKREDIPASKPHNSFYGFIDYVVSVTLFAGLGIVCVGAGFFLVGLLIFVWAKQPLLVSIVSTVPCVVIGPLLAAIFVPHISGRRNIIEMLARKQGDW